MWFSDIGATSIATSGNQSLIYSMDQEKKHQGCQSLTGHLKQKDHYGPFVYLSFRNLLFAAQYRGWFKLCSPCRRVPSGDNTQNNGRARHQ
ncbi:hypothetical protein XM72_c11020 [Vibrio vulnificus]|nr:hypothetical protein XM72_c11020 [Vibrio vulnificus]